MLVASSTLFGCFLFPEEPEYCTVTFNSMQGTTVQPVSVEKGKTFTKPTDPTRPNFDFDGWFQDAQLTRPWNFNTNTVIQNIVLYARWSAKKVTVRFENCATEVDRFNPQFVDINGQYNSLPTPVRAGFVFGGWYTKDGRQTGDWGNGPIAAASINTNTADHWLYAKWLTNVVLKINLLGGEYVDTSRHYEIEYTVIAGKDAYITNLPNAKLPTAQRKGYRFDGWWSKDGSAGGGLTGDWGVEINPIGYIPEGVNEVVIYARWTKGVAVTLMTNGGRGITTEHAVLPDGNYNLDIPYKPGSRFLGWFTNNNEVWYKYPALQCGFQPSHPDNAKYFEDGPDKWPMNTPHCTPTVNPPANGSPCGENIGNADFARRMQSGGDMAPVEQPASWGTKVELKGKVVNEQDHFLYARWNDNAVGSIVSAGGGITNYVDLQSGNLWSWGGEVSNANVKHQYGPNDNIASSSTYNATTSLPLNVRGDGGTAASQVPTSNQTKKYSTIKSSHSQTLAIDSDGNLWGWGRRYSGVLPATSGATSHAHSTAFQTTPVQIMPSTKFVDVALNGYHMGAADFDYNDYSSNTKANRQNASNYDPTGFYYSYYYFALAVDIYGGLWAWGNNSWGQLGDGTTTNRLTPVKISEISNSPIKGRRFEKVSAGENFAIAITGNGDSTPGQMFSWGGASNTSMGGSSTGTSVLGRTGGYTFPAAVMPGTYFGEVACGENYAVAVDWSGTLYAWGSRADGRLGDGSTTGTTSVPNPIPVPENTKFDFVTTSAGSTIAIDKTGSLWAWGRNGNGQLGLGHLNAQSTPQKINLGGAIVLSVSIGSNRIVSQPNRNKKTVSESSTSTSAWPNYHSSTDTWRKERGHSAYCVHYAEQQTSFSFNYYNVVMLAIPPENDKELVYGWGSNVFGQVGNNMAGSLVVTTPTLLNTHSNPENFGKCVICGALIPAGGSNPCGKH